MLSIVGLGIGNHLRPLGQELLFFSGAHHLLLRRRLFGPMHAGHTRQARVRVGAMAGQQQQIHRMNERVEGHSIATMGFVSAPDP